MTASKNQVGSVPLALCWSLIAASLAALVVLGGWMVRDPDRFVPPVSTTATPSVVVEFPVIAHAGGRAPNLPAQAVAPSDARPIVPETVPTVRLSSLATVSDDQHSDWVVVPGSGSDTAHDSATVPVAPILSMLPPPQRDARELARTARAMAAQPDDRAVIARIERYEEQRDEELAVLAGLSLRVRFAAGESDVAGSSRQALDLMFDPLFVYPDAAVMVSVLGSEIGNPAQDRLLAQRRAASLIDYFVTRGLLRDRFEVLIDLESSVPGAGLPVHGQRVRVKAESRRS